MATMRDPDGGSMPRRKPGIRDHLGIPGVPVEGGDISIGDRGEARFA